MQLILVDDDPISRRLLSAQLRALGYSVAEYEDGQDAWEALQHTLVPLVISDWQMPGLDGPGLVQRIRSAELPGYVYCILLTSPGEPSDRMLGLEAGADDYLTKPIPADDLQSRLTIATRILRLEQELRAAQGVKAMLSSQLKQQATHDLLTGVLHRQAILAIAQEQLTLAAQEGTAFSLALIHLEHLKEVNATHGNASGDTALRQVVQVVQNKQGITLGRWGDATFLAVLPGWNAISSQSLAEQWKQNLTTEPILIADNQPLLLSIHVRISTREGTEASVERMIEAMK